MGAGPLAGTAPIEDTDVACPGPSAEGVGHPHAPARGPWCLLSPRRRGRDWRLTARGWRNRRAGSTLRSCERRWPRLRAPGVACGWPSSPVSRWLGGSLAPHTGLFAGTRSICPPRIGWLLSHRGPPVRAGRGGVTLTSALLMMPFWGAIRIEPSHRSVDVSARARSRSSPGFDRPGLDSPWALWHQAPCVGMEESLG